MMKIAIKPRILATLWKIERVLLLVVAVLSAAYLASHSYISSPGTAAQQTTYQLLVKIAGTTGIWQSYNTFHYALEASEKILLGSAYLLAAIFFVIMYSAQRINAAAVLRVAISVLMVKAAGSAEFTVLVLAYGLAVGMDCIKIYGMGPKIAIKNTALRTATGLIPFVIFLASLLPGLVVPYILDVSLSSAAWTHYKNAISIYETGLPSLGKDFFDARFVIYPPLSHYLLVLAKIGSGRSILSTLQASYAFFSALTIIMAYLLAREISGKWYATAVSVYAGLNPHLLGAAFFGNYAELVSSTIAGGCLFCLARYEKKNNRRYLAASAVLFTATIATHWLFAMVLAAFFMFYFATMRLNRKDALLFFSTAALALLPYLVFFAGKIHNAPDLAWIFKEYPTNQPCDMRCMLLPTFLRFKPLLAQSDLVLLVFGAIGLAFGIRVRAMRIPAIMFLVSAFGFYFLRDYLTFFYPNRLLWLTKFYFAYFIGYGIYATAKEGLIKNGRAGSFFLMALIGLILTANLYDQTSHLRAMGDEKQALAVTDKDAVLWIKENTNAQDIIAADALRMETVYGFTRTRVLQPPQAAIVLAEPERRGDGMLAFISSPEGACKFPCSDAIQLKKNESLVKRWANLSFEKTKKSMAENSKIFFEENGTYIFRLK